MKYVALLVLTMAVTPLLSQDLNTYNEPSNQHQVVKGTRVAMIPPQGFQQGDNYKGFANPEDPTTGIMVMEIPGPIEEVSTGFTEDLMAKRGMKLISKMKTRVAGRDGFLLEIEQEAQGSVFYKMLLVYGHDKGSVMVNGYALKGDPEAIKQLQTAIHTTTEISAVNPDPRAALDYSVDESPGNLQVVFVMGNSLVLNRDGKTPTESPDKLVFLIDKSYAKSWITDRPQFCINRLQMMPGSPVYNEEKGVEPVEMDGLKGFELFGFKEEMNEELVMRILFVEDGGYFILLGTYLKGNEKAFRDITAVMDTFKRQSE